jgi:mannose-6-phosphate isomerase-like protein (cupin superfamily)
MNEELDFPFQITGEKRARALAHCQDTIRAWGLTMPDVEPLLLDFGLGKFDEIGETEFWIANDPETGYCGKFLFVADGQTCPYHHHAMKHETFFLVKGTLQLVVDEEEMILQEGDTLVMPPGRRHSFTGVGPALLLEVSMPSVRQDNLFADSAIGDDGVI